MTFTSIEQYEQYYFPTDYAKRKRAEAIGERGLAAVLVEESMNRVFGTEASHEQ